MDYPQDLVNLAYKLARPHGVGSDLSRIEIIERLTRDKIPTDLAEQAADDVLLDRGSQHRKDAGQLLIWGIVVTCLGALVIAAGPMLSIPVVIVPAAFFIGLTLTAAGLWRRYRSTSGARHARP